MCLLRANGATVRRQIVVVKSLQKDSPPDSRVFGHPLDIFPGVFRGYIKRNASADAKKDISVLYLGPAPFADEGVPVRKGKSAGTVVIIGRKVYDSCGARD